MHSLSLDIVLDSAPHLLIVEGSSQQSPTVASQVYVLTLTIHPMKVALCGLSKFYFNFDELIISYTFIRSLATPPKFAKAFLTILFHCLAMSEQIL